jgi:hypothetical protein
MDEKKQSSQAHPGTRYWAENLIFYKHLENKKEEKRWKKSGKYGRSGS